MRKHLISVSLMVFLVFPGLIGNVYGQIDTAMPNRFLNQNPYKLKLNLDYNPDINNNLNNRYYYSNTHQRGPTNFGIGTGIYYQWGFYGGEISNYISDNRVFIYPIINFDFYFKRFIFQMFMYGYGTFTVNSVNINGDNFKGTFYGEYSSFFNMAMGYEVYGKSNISIIPNIGFQPRQYSIYPGDESGIIGHGNPLKDIIIDSYSFGFMADYKIVKMNVLHDSYVSIRFKYDYCFTAKQYEYYNGTIHQFTVGLTTTFRDNKNR